MDTVFMQNLTTGLIIALIGMVTVLVFLIIMICAIEITKKFITYINKYFPEVEEVQPSKKIKQDKKADDEVALAVLLATLQKGK